MRFLKSLTGALLAVTVLVCVVAAALVALRVRATTHPPRVVPDRGNVAALLAHVEEVRFPSSDGLTLAAWLVPGRPGGRSIVLGHDLGGSKASVINVALPLQRAGFTVLAIDFRGHGDSDGDGSTLGVTEKRDILGAVDYLTSRPGADRTHMGVYGVGMGAFAAALAAEDRPSLRVLVLDGIYPDVEYPLVRRVYASWPWGVAHLGFLPRAVFDWTHRDARSEQRSADAVRALAGRSVLLVASASDTALSAEIESMYRSIPVREDVEGNLITLPGTGAGGLDGAEMERYIERVATFFRSRLGPTP